MTAPLPATERSHRREHASTPERRRQIVKAALASFAAHGYERASLRDIAARADLTHAALLRHFSGKDELLLAALAQREADEEEMAARIGASHMPAEKILGVVLAAEFADPDYQRNWMSLTVAATDPEHPAHGFFVGRRERMRGRFTSGPLPLARETGETTADEKATLVLAMIDGLRIQWLLDPSRDALALLELFMKLFGGPPTEEGADTGVSP